MLKVWKEFRTFILRGNVIDLAVAFIISTAFNKVVSSLVNDVIMPPIGLVLGRMDFQNLFISLSRHQYATLAEAEKAGAPTLNYGTFIQNVVDFFIIAAVVYFVIVRTNEHFKRRSATAPAPPTTKLCDYCFTEIPVQATRCPNCTSLLAKVGTHSDH
ncbi:MAG: large conductance mechanosensitive channel protein MscL [Alicyclobacillus sp.]|nr:large conductance mechanosensitive channel protein MscL [Alicyclobacillus sp.]